MYIITVVLLQHEPAYALQNDEKCIWCMGPLEELNNEDSGWGRELEGERREGGRENGAGGGRGVREGWTKTQVHLNSFSRMHVDLAAQVCVHVHTTACLIISYYSMILILRWWVKQPQKPSWKSWGQKQSELLSSFQLWTNCLIA